MTTATEKYNKERKDVLPKNKVHLKQPSVEKVSKCVLPTSSCPSQKEKPAEGRKVTLAEKKGTQPRKIVYTEERVGCQLQDLDLRSPGICRYRDREEGCVNGECRFTHRKPEHMIHFETQDFSHFSLTSEYRRYNKQYLQARDDLKRDCQLCKEMKREEEFLKRKVYPGMNLVRSSDQHSADQHEKAEPLVKKFRKRKESFDLRRKLHGPVGDNETRAFEEPNPETDFLQLRLDSEDEDFFKERTEIKKARKGNNEEKQTEEKLRRRVAEEEKTRRRLAEEEKPRRRVNEEENPRRRDTEERKPRRRVAEDEKTRRRVDEEENPRRRSTEEGKLRRRVTEEDETMRIEVPSTTAVFEGNPEQRNVKYMGGIMTIEKEENDKRVQECFAIIEEIGEDQEVDDVASEGRNVQIVSTSAETEEKRLPVHQRIGRSRCWSTSATSSLSETSGSSSSSKSRPKEEVFRADDEDQDSMKQTLIQELTNFLIQQPNQECKMNEIHLFSRTSTFKPSHFGFSRWIELLSTVDAVSVVGDLYKFIRLNQERSESVEEMKQVMVKELRDFLFHEPTCQCPMNEIHRFNSSYSPEHFGSRWSDLVPTLGVATILGSGKEKHLLLNSKHYKIALSHFKRDVTELLIKHGPRPMSLVEVNRHLFGEDSLVEKEWIRDRLKGCTPEIKMKRDRSRPNMILVQLQNN